MEHIWHTWIAVGILSGFVLGGMIGQLPLFVGLKSMARRFDRMTNEQLVDELHDHACLTPNLLLLELDRRGYDIRRELPFVQSFLASEEMHRRTAGWAALTSVFPELFGQISGYNPTASSAECNAKCKPLPNGDEPIGAPAPPVLGEEERK